MWRHPIKDPASWPQHKKDRKVETRFRTGAPAQMLGRSIQDRNRQTFFHRGPDNGPKSARKYSAQYFQARTGFIKRNQVTAAGPDELTLWAEFSQQNTHVIW